MKQNKLNKDHRKINMRAFEGNLENCVIVTSYLFIQKKKEDKNDTRKQSLFENINMPCRVCIHIVQSKVYALKQAAK